ncbi:DNA-methyltransferase [Pacificibacter marinus]|uniref:Methyltransferase n=1 Tax=Pacificibacter marinus TaxID=658057 RepID=A0A1Y5TZ32_9RHOB|nr:DNA methyltransferase [Pacificibacter marinus]SEL41138.1 site-specific DNA-methyltransferase (adenine-specific) [Pacificibacter marinus]SLN71680.1 Modification methylase DpnIIB [Pacificibacter marinus]
MSIRREITIGTARLILGDCREVLPELRGVADMLFCDVAYKLTSGGNAHQSMGGLFAKENYENDGLLMDVPSWHDLGGPFFRAYKDNADAYIMTNDKNLFQAGAAFEGAGWKFHNLLVWDKIRATRNRWYMKNLEFTTYWWKGKADPLGINHCGSKQSFQLNAPKETAHPTEKPIALCEHYILNSTTQGDTVLDPMMGSGAAMVAAVQNGRHAIGIEINETWFDVACARVRKALA